MLSEENEWMKTAVRPVKRSAGEMGECESADLSRVNEKRVSFKEQECLFITLNNCSRALSSLSA